MQQTGPLPPEITKHYQQQHQYSSFHCKYCPMQFLLNTSKTIEQMIWHTQSFHYKQANPSLKRYTLEEKMDNLKPPPKYLSKYENMDIISDRWLDRLILDGYAVSHIMHHVFQRLSADSDLFLKSCERRAKILHKVQPHVIKYLPYIPLHFLPDESIQHLSSRFKISYEAAGLLLRRHSWSFQPGSKMYRALKKLDVGVKVMRQSNNTDAVTVVVSPRMKYLYTLYGDCINLEYRFVPLKRSRSGMHYNIVLFLGQDAALRVILFGVALLNGFCLKNLKACIYMFVQIMDKKCPLTFITDYSNTMLQALDQIKSQSNLSFKHMINWFYATQKLKLQLANEPDYRQCLRILSSALSAISREEYHHLLLQLRNTGRIDPRKLLQFQQSSQKCCFGVGEPMFVGFGVQQDRVLSVTKAVQASFFYMNRIGLFYSLAFRLENRWNSIVQSNLKKSHKFEHYILQLQHLSTKLSRQIFTKLQSLYVHSLSNLQILGKHNDELSYKIRDKSKSSEVGEFVVRYYIQDCCWRCNCMLIYWSGLPCEHLIKIVRFFQGSIAYYIGERWRTHTSWGNIPAFQTDPNDNSRFLQSRTFNGKAKDQEDKPKKSECKTDLVKIQKVEERKIMEMESVIK